MKNLNRLFSVLGLSLIFVLSGCKGTPQQNKSPLVKDVHMTTSLNEENKLYLNVMASFQLGQVTIDADNLEIVDPYDSSIKYGELIFKPVPNKPGFNKIGVRLNLSNIGHVGSGTPTLPNGEALPIGTVSPKSKLYEVYIPQINSKLYIGLGPDMTIMGFAITLKEFDAVADYVNDANVFLGFTIKGVQGNAGIYTGTSTMESGLGFFVDLSSVVTTDIINDLLNSFEVTPERYAAMKQTLAEMDEVDNGKFLLNRMIFKNSNYNKRNLRGFYKAFKRMGKKKISIRD